MEDVLKIFCCFF